MATIHVTPEHLGDVATNEDVQRMAEFLQAKGYTVVTQDGTDEFEDDAEQAKFEADWEAGLEVVGTE